MFGIFRLILSSIFLWLFFLAMVQERSGTSLALLRFLFRPPSPPQNHPPKKNQSSISNNENSNTGNTSPTPIQKIEIQRIFHEITEANIMITSEIIKFRNFSDPSPTKTSF